MAKAAKPREWGNAPSLSGEPQRVIKLRRLMLVHSYVYYELDDALVSDHQWMGWAQELASLQVTHGFQHGFYDEAFRNWDGSSGFQLPMRDLDVINTATRLLRHRDKT